MTDSFKEALENITEDLMCGSIYGKLNKSQSDDIKTLKHALTIATESEQLRNKVRQLNLACEIHEHTKEQLRKERDDLAVALEDILHSAFEHGSQNLSGKTLDPDGEMLWKAKQLIKKIRGAKDEIR